MPWLVALFMILLALLRGAGGSVPSQACSYDAVTGEPAAVTSGTASVAYSYRTGTRQIEGVTNAASAVTGLTQTRTYDDLHRLTGVTSQNGASLSASGYARTLPDAAPARCSETGLTGDILTTITAR